MSDLELMITAYERACEAYEKQNQALRDERDRLMKFAKMVGHPQWCPGFMTRQSELCTCGWYEIFPAALTPAAGESPAALNERLKRLEREQKPKDTY